MKRAFILLFLAAMIVAIPLMIQAGLWSFFLALLCVSFGILYTGGPKPLGYIGAGEVLVFIFFGPIATCGSYFLQTGFVTMPVLIASFAPGLLSCSILIANNLRDEKSDKQAGKNTLIARFGKKFGAFEYLFSIFLAVMIPPILVALYGAPPMLLTACIIELLAIPAINKVFSFRDPLEIMPLLPASGALLLIYTALFCTFAR
jgi:1,4-dihydroxy-2-naphthoate octaprenyltransferase